MTKTSRYLAAGALIFLSPLLSQSIVSASDQQAVSGSTRMAAAALYAPQTNNLASTGPSQKSASATPDGTSAVPITSAPVPLMGQTIENGAFPGYPQTFRRDPSQSQSADLEESPHALHPLPDDAIWLMAYSSQVFDFPYRLRRVSIADSKVADIQVITPYQINLIGHHPGFTTLTAWDQVGHYEQRQVRVDVGGKQQVLLKCIVAQLDRAKIENQGINLAAALQNTGLSMVSLPGSVATPYSSSATLPPGGNLIPMLLSQSLTFGLAGSFGQFNFAAFIQALESHNMAKILAQPDLLANSGEKAQFLAGGEIPIVIAQALNSSVVFKQYGTKVNFLPTVVGHNDIEMLVEPEVSEPDYNHQVQLNGFTVPAFLTRRAHTMVRLKNGQTLIIAGLTLNEEHSVVEKVPYLGDVPFAGALFRTTSHEHDSSDLVMVVTPELVTPLPEGSQAYLPSSRGPMTSSEIETRQLATPDASRPRF